MVLCFPSVQGVISRNSSNVRTLGLQHFQPVYIFGGEVPSRPDHIVYLTSYIRACLLTFLPLVKDGRTRMVLADLVWVCVLLVATLVDTFLSHVRLWLRL